MQSKLAKMVPSEQRFKWSSVFSCLHTRDCYNCSSLVAETNSQLTKLTWHRDSSVRLVNTAATNENSPGIDRFVDGLHMFAGVADRVLAGSATKCQLVEIQVQLPQTKLTQPL